MRFIQDGEVQQLQLGGNIGITWLPWRKHQENALIIRVKRHTWRFGFKYTND